MFSVFSVYKRAPHSVCSCFRSYLGIVILFVDPCKGKQTCTASWKAIIEKENKTVLILTRKLFFFNIFVFVSSFLYLIYSFPLSFLVCCFSFHFISTFFVTYCFVLLFHFRPFFFAFCPCSVIFTWSNTILCLLFGSTIKYYSLLNNTILFFVVFDA